MEQLDHRQLLSVNFTGNVTTDFPASQSPGVVVLPDNPNVEHPGIPPDLQGLVHVSGFDVTGVRVSYDSQTDVLSIGLDQPPSGNPGQPGEVIAGDADNNGNDGTTNPAVQAAVAPTPFTDFPDFGGSEHMGAFLDLTGSGYADVVAGYSTTDPRSPKEYQVAQAIVNTNAPPSTPDFGTMLPQFTGNVYKVNSPAHPNLEFNIDNFSKLYLQETGKTLTPDSVIGVGAFGGSGDDDGIGEGFFPEQSFPVKNATPPPVVCPPPPPASPPVLINPHENRHINTAHPTEIRVTVFGTVGFDVTQINQGSVTFGGAHPIFSYTRDVNKDNYLDETFVFKGTDVNLPPGVIRAPITGTLLDGQSWIGASQVFNRTDAFYAPSAVSAAQQRQAANPNKLLYPISKLEQKVMLNGDHVVAAGATSAANVPAASASALQVDYSTPQTVKIQRHNAAHKVAPKISHKLEASMESLAASQAQSSS